MNDGLRHVPVAFLPACPGARGYMDLGRRLRQRQPKSFAVRLQFMPIHTGHAPLRPASPGRTAPRQATPDRTCHATHNPARPLKAQPLQTPAWPVLPIRARNRLTPLRPTLLCPARPAGPSSDSPRRAQPRLARPAVPRPDEPGQAKPRLPRPTPPWPHPQRARNGPIRARCSARADPRRCRRPSRPGPQGRAVALRSRVAG